jgi:hypothetical protein
MHPIEYLRHVARASGADPALLVAETASALCAMRLDQPGLVLATRRIVDKHPTCAPLWWLCAGALSSIEPAVRLRELAQQFETDPTPELLFDLADEDAFVVEAMAMGDDGGIEVLVSSSDARDVEWAREVGHSTIVVARRGTRLPIQMWREMKKRAMAGENEWTHDVQLVNVRVFDLVVGPSGVERSEDATFAPECAPCPELLVGGGL